MTVLGSSGRPVAPVLDLYAGQGIRLDAAARMSAEAEDAGFGGLWSLDAGTSPFLPLALAAQHTTRLRLRTAVAVALARNPMVVAQVSHELNAFSKGRFELGLGPQVRAHITRRYGAVWSSPARRMREFVQAVKAIWACWDDDVPLAFSGDYYTHTLMTPTFSPGPSAWGRPAVLLAAVGPRMLAVAAEVADGVIAHPLSSVRLLRDVTLPALRTVRGELDLRADFEVSCPVLVVTGSSRSELAAAREQVRRQLAFYASTPAYRSALELYDEGGTADRLRALSVEQRWDEMSSLVSDDLLREFSVEAGPDELRQAVAERFTGVLDRVALYAPYPVGAALWAAVLAA